MEVRGVCRVTEGGGVRWGKNEEAPAAWLSGLSGGPPGGGGQGAVTYSPTFAVPSARRGLTSLFGMGRGGTPVLWPP